MTDDAMRLLSPQQLQGASLALLSSAGFGEREAQLTASHLVEANLRGHDSHGVGVLPMYLRNARSGELVVGQSLKVPLDTGAMLICDGGQGPGQAMAQDAMVLGIERASQQGSAIVSLRNSHHIGRIGHYAEQCAAAGMVSLHFVNVAAGAFVAPFGGTKARLGTNPFAAGFPREGAPPIVVDFATSRLAAGKVRVARNKGVPIPPGALLDSLGNPTTDPAKLFEDPPGSLLPFGEHKGFGMMLACELLGAALVGGVTQQGPAGPGPVLNSMFSVIVAPERIGTAAAFREELEGVLAWVLSENAEGKTEILLPGMPELVTRAARLRDGVPIDPATLDQLSVLGREFGVADLGY